jgi:hypothetical protein
VAFPKDVQITDEGKDLIKHMLHPDPEKRLELMELMELPYSKYSDEEFIKIFEATKPVPVKENQEEEK